MIVTAQLKTLFCCSVLWQRVFFVFATANVAKKEGEAKERKSPKEKNEDK